MIVILSFKIIWWTHKDKYFFEDIATYATIIFAKTRHNVLTYVCKVIDYVYTNLFFFLSDTALSEKNMECQNELQSTSFLIIRIMFISDFYLTRPISFCKKYWIGFFRKFKAVNGEYDYVFDGIEDIKTFDDNFKAPLDLIL